MDNRKDEQFTDDPSTSSNHHHHHHHHHKTKNGFLGFLSRRSTKVEPHPISDTIAIPNDIHKRTRNSDTSANITQFAKCSPLKRIKRHCRNYSSHSDTEDNLPVSYKLNNSHNNRFSHQFSLCCSVEERPTTPPVSVRYNSLPESVNFQTKTPVEIDRENNIEPTCSSAPESPLNGKFVPQTASSSPTSGSLKSGASEDQPRSIAITACRSRLRVKLLPPGKTIVSSLVNAETAQDVPEQHMSSPNIYSNAESEKGLDNAKSASHEAVQTIHRVNKTPGASTDSLARQALMAAQVLNLIPTEKARERNYMVGRLAANPLLGISELIRVLPNKEIKIFVGTWNMNGQYPPKQMNDFVLPTGVEHVPDLVAIGTQESCSERFEWEVTLQETLGPTHILFHSASLGTLHLAIFLRRDLIWFCSVPEDASMSVRPGTAFRTKGAVAISFSLFGTSMLFVTSHLTAHQQKVKERVQDVKRIIHALDLPKNLTIRYKNKDVTQNFDCVFWSGDLNFRLSEPREKLLKWIENTKFPLPSHLPHGYMHTDQLSSVLADGAAFKGFMEANITFPPTYKYDPGTQQFDTSSKQRAPAYTDRILYKYKLPSTGFRRGSTLSGPFLSQQTPPVECLAYDSVPSITTSDHKPVWALFRNTIKPGIDSIPLAAGLFNREVYLEGMRRRLNNVNYESSAVCTIQ